MPSQYDYLVDDELRDGLRCRDPAAEVKLAQRFNRGRRPEGRIAIPATKGDYAEYDGRLLALLWSLVRNASALRALTAGEDGADAAPSEYARMTDEQIAFLWTWGRDAGALETLWTRRGWLPIGDVNDQTPDAILGFLWWRYRRPDARDELFERYHLGGATDAAQDHALTLLLVVDRWDYERYTSLANLLSVSAAHQRIDTGRHRARAPQVDQIEAENAAAPSWSRPETAVEDRDYLETNTPLELRCLHKIKENSEEQPLDLTAEELDYLARKNLAHAGYGERSGPPLARERSRIVEWMARNPEPGEEQIRACLPWFRQSGLARQTRLWRLHRRADENDRLLTPLLANAGEEAIDLACRVQENMDELVRRIESAGRNEAPDDRGPVLLFAELLDAAERLRNVLGACHPHNGRMAHLGDWRTNLGAFLDSFPILVKLAACRRLVYWLLHAGFPPQEMPILRGLSDWLDGGRWLATFGREDRAQGELFRRGLLALRDPYRGDSRTTLDLLILWLESTREPGAPDGRLLDADRSWWLQHDSPRKLACTPTTTHR